MTTKAQPGDCNILNRTIFKGDNLDVMRGINGDSVDLIYLDPPFNSNRNYAAPIGSKAAGAAFKDSWDLTDVDELWHNEIADTNLALYKAIDASQFSHGDGMKSYLIMMAVRLLEMKRILKPNGSIYLHCDTTASHYLKMLMDAVFGRDNFRNEIIWKRFNFHADARRFGKISDSLLFYSKTGKYVFNRQKTPYSKEYIESKFRHVDEDGRRFRLDNLNPPGGRGPVYEFHGVTKAWRYAEDNMRALEREGRIYTKSRIAQLKRYLDELDGQAINNIWVDISPINPRAKERTGYPTQKPPALLDRIIQASSNPGDVVLDPFCGCATTCIAAERLERQWIGIDLSPMAVQLVEQRARNELGMMGGIQSISRTDIPLRTDLDTPPPLDQSKITLYGQQAGHCNGCGVHFMQQHLTVDHIVAKSKGGTDHIENLQLLCGHCNSLKGNRPMEYLRARLAKDYV